MLQKSGRAIRQKGRRGLNIQEETGKGGRRRGVCERKGVTECNDNARFMQPCTAEELANALATFSRPSMPPLRSLSLSLSRALRCSCCNAVAVGRKPQRKETSRIALRARALGLLCRRSLSAEMHRCPRENFGLVDVLCELLSLVKGRRNHGDREVTKVDGGQITDR